MTNENKDSMLNRLKAPVPAPDEPSWFERVMKMNKSEKEETVVALVKDIYLFTNVYPVDQEHENSLNSGIYRCLFEIADLLDFELVEEY